MKVVKDFPIHDKVPPMIPLFDKIKVRFDAKIGSKSFVFSFCEAKYAEKHGIQKRSSNSHIFSASFIENEKFYTHAQFKFLC